METIKEWWNKHQEQKREVETERIKSDFNVHEQCGNIYLTHHGYAFAVMAKNATADEIAYRLEETRKAALEFEGL